jgi:hypothetical protein
MKLIWALILVSLTAFPVQSKERLPFPFDQSTRVTFIRLGNIELDAGQQFALSFRDGQWTIERRISRYSATYQDISPDEAYEILKAFSEVYRRWQNSPYRDVTKNGYSLYISIDQTWQTTIRVRDRGSPELRQLIKTIEYPVGLVLNEVRTNNVPGEIQASTAGTNTSSTAAP